MYNPYLPPDRQDADQVPPDPDTDGYEDQEERCRRGDCVIVQEDDYEICAHCRTIVT